MADKRTAAFSSYQIYLMAYNGTDYARLVNIKSMPDLGGAPEQLETTTLSNKMNTYCAGIQSFDSLEFTCNYTKDAYDKVLAYFGESATRTFCVYIGDSGVDGKFYFNATGAVNVAGAGVNEVVEMTITLSPSTDIKTEAPSTVYGEAFTAATDDTE